MIRRRAAKMRKQLAAQRAESASQADDKQDQAEEEEEYEYRYTARSEVGKVKFAAAIRTSLLRPLSEYFGRQSMTRFGVRVGNRQARGDELTNSVLGAGTGSHVLFSLDFASRMSHFCADRV